MPNTVEFILPEKRYKARSSKTIIRSIRLTKKQYEEIIKIAEQLGITPHYFMKWCILAATKAYKNDGKYKKINVI